MKGILPHLWFNHNLLPAASLYTEAIANSKIDSSQTLRETPSGDVQILEFQLEGVPFQGINGGPYFSFNPTTSIMVILETLEGVDELYNLLSPGGQVLMPLQSYDFCQRYSWISDAYGLHWQLMYVDSQMLRQRPLSKIRPCLLFSGQQRGRAREAMDFYLSVFSAREPGTSRAGSVDYSPQKLMNYGELTLAGTELVLMDNAYDEDGATDLAFSEAFSLVVTCETQEEIDYYWDKLSAVPEAEQCGWLKDVYGFSWQIVPFQLGNFMQGPEAAVRRVTNAFLAMKKFDIEALTKAYNGVAD